MSRFLKKMSGRTCFIFFLLLFQQGLDAQVPGFRGHRLSVGYNASSFFVFEDLFWGGTGGDLLVPKLSYKTEVNLHYTVSRKVTLGTSYYFAKQNYHFVGTD